MKRLVISLMLLSLSYINSASLALEKHNRYSISTIDGKSISFNPQLLLQSEVIRESIKHFHNGILTHEALEQFSRDFFTTYLFKDDNSLDKVAMNGRQVYLLLKALEHNDSDLQIFEYPKRFALSCPERDRLWLINHLSRWDIRNIYDALLKCIIQDLISPSTIQSYQIENLYDPHAINDITQHCNISSQQPYIHNHVAEEYNALLTCCKAPLKIMRFDNSETHALIACAEHLHLFNIAEQKIVASFKAPLNSKNDHIVDALCDNHNRLLIQTRFNAYMYDLATKNKIGDYHCPYGSTIIGFVKQGEQLYIQEHYNRLLCYNTLTHTVESEHPIPDDCTVCKYNPHGDQQIIATPDGTKLIIIDSRWPRGVRLYIYDVQREQYTHHDPFIHTFSHNIIPLKCINMSNNHAHLVIATVSEVSLHTIRTHAVRAYPTPPQSKLYFTSTQFIDNDRLLIADNHNVVIYDIDTNNQTWQLRDTPFEIHSAALTPDGQHIITTEHHTIRTHSLLPLDMLEMDQRLLLIKALYAWNKKRAYALQPEEEKIYRYLPTEFHKPTLFTLTSRSKEAEKEEDI